MKKSPFFKYYISPKRFATTCLRPIDELFVYTQYIRKGKMKGKRISILRPHYMKVFAITASFRFYQFICNSRLKERDAETSWTE